MCYHWEQVRIWPSHVRGFHERMVLFHFSIVYWMWYDRTMKKKVTCEHSAQILFSVYYFVELVVSLGLHCIFWSSPHRVFLQWISSFVPTKCTRHVKYIYLSVNLLHVSVFITPSSGRRVTYSNILCLLQYCSIGCANFIYNLCVFLNLQCWKQCVFRPSVC
jgi:hypothetical protein